MNRLSVILATSVFGFLAWSASAHADNLLFLDQFSADPAARLFEGKIYLYNSHDILPPNGGRGGFFMADYHVYSSEDLMEWTDHGVIVAEKDVPWANQNMGMWAPDCVFKNNKYYFYFPTNSKDMRPASAPATAPTTRGGRGGLRGIQRIGVAIADKPYGPFKIEPNYIPGIPRSIDPSVLIDPKDGSAYLIYALNDFFIAKLKENMLELAEAPKLMTKFPDTRRDGLIEGPFAFERKGKYYIAYPHAVGTERLEYAMAENPEGPYTVKGVIMDQLESKCWTNQCSLVEYQGQWLLFYHDKDLSPNDDARRCVRADYVTFNDDGTMNKVIPTLRGVGICDAKKRIQIDRYSAVSKTGTAISFVDEDKKSEGWKIALTEKDAFVQYDRVDFGKVPLIGLRIRARSSNGGMVEIHVDKPDGPIVAEVEIPKADKWQEIVTNLTVAPTAIHNLVLRMHEASNVEIDWVSFQ